MNKIKSMVEKIKQRQKILGFYEIVKTYQESKLV
jgi:hypothetical protein